jgi:predicted metalloprotease with PDZ domain
LFDEITKLTYPEIRAFFSKYVEGNEMLPYETFFGMAGVKYIPKKETIGFTLGSISIKPDEKGGAKIASIANMNEFGKKMGYQKNDEIISINNEQVNAVNFQDIAGKFTATAKEGDTLTVKVKRKNAAGELETVILSAPATKISKTDEHMLEFETPDEEQLKIRNAWLNSPCKK